MPWFKLAYQTSSGNPCCPGRVGLEGEFESEEAAKEHGRQTFGDRAFLVYCEEKPNPNQKK